MDAVSDDLTRPLGLDPPPEVRWPNLRRLAAPALAATLALGVVALGAFLALSKDPIGGEPRAVASIEVAKAAPPPPVPAEVRSEQGPGPDGRSDRTSATDIESASGVSVVRAAGGTAPPGSVIIRVPDDGALAPSPDQRIAERTRNGILPKRGGDGSRALEVYARPLGAGPTGGPRIAMVVTGLGIGPDATANAIAKLPGPVSLAFAPYGAGLERSAAQAREAGHEILLQAPMEPFDYPDNDPGPHTLLTDAKPAETLDRLRWIMSRFTGYIGVVNFMGAKLMANEGALSVVLREIGSRGLGFLDDGSSPRSIAGALAGRVGTPEARADALLDAVPKPETVARELAALEALARRRGAAIGVASALPATVDQIARWSRSLEAKGIRLVPVSSMLGAERGR